MNTIKSLTRYILYTLLAVVFLSLTSCDTMEAEGEYDKRYWEIEKMRLELEYLKDLHDYKSELEIRQKIAEVDSLIQNYR